MTGFCFFFYGTEYLLPLFTRGLGFNSNTITKQILECKLEFCTSGSTGWYYVSVTVLRLSLPGILQKWFHFSLLFFSATWRTRPAGFHMAPILYGTGSDDFHALKTCSTNFCSVSTVLQIVILHNLSYLFLLWLYCVTEVWFIFYITPQKLFSIPWLIGYVFFLVEVLVFLTKSTTSYIHSLLSNYLT